MIRHILLMIIGTLFLSRVSLAQEYYFEGGGMFPNGLSTGFSGQEFYGGYDLGSMMRAAPVESPAGESQGTPAVEGKESITALISEGDGQPPELAPLRDALAKQMARWSPEKTLLETVSPAVVLQMAFPFGAEGRFLCRTVAQDAGSGGKRAATEPAYAVGVLCWNFPIGGKKLLTESQGGIFPRVGWQYQRSGGELLFALASSRVATDYALRVGAEKSVTIAALIESEKSRISFREDHALTAAALAFYVENATATWRGFFGQEVSLVSLADYELNRPVFWTRSDSIDRLLGLTLLSKRFHRDIAGGKSDPQLLDVSERIDRYLAILRPYAEKQRGANGLWQTRFLSNEPAKEETVELLLVNGHLLRFLIAGASRAELESETMRRSVYHLALYLAKTRRPTDPLGDRSPREIEAIGVVLHALSLYLAGTE